MAVLVWLYWLKKEAHRMVEREHPINVEGYVDQMAEMLELPLDEEFRPGVIGNFARTAAIAQLVLEFPLPDDCEAAPTFQP